MSGSGRARALVKALTGARTEQRTQALPSAQARAQALSSAEAQMQEQALPSAEAQAQAQAQAMSLVEARETPRAKGSAELTATQAALAAEHAAVYGYGVVGGRISEGRRTEARAAYDAHRARRDELARSVRDLGGKPEPAAAAYALPFQVTDPESAVRLAAELEDRVAGVYSDLVRAAGGDRRLAAAEALRDAAVRAVRWRGGSVAFPGLAERSATATAPAAPSS